MRVIHHRTAKANASGRRLSWPRFALALTLTALVATPQDAQQGGLENPPASAPASDAPAESASLTQLPLALDRPNARAETPAAMQAYVESVPGTGLELGLVPIPAGRVDMGSPAEESDRGDDEGPQHTVELAPFWMSEHEVTWALFNEFLHKLDVARHESGELARVPQDDFADAVSRPTPPYMPLDDGPATAEHPAAGMTQLAARQFTKWLSMKTGRFYRLPSEAEWEYAARAESTTRWSFGDDEALLGAHAWTHENADGRSHQVGTLAPNKWGLFDMHGNVAEWVLDAYGAGYELPADGATRRDPVVWPTRLYPRVVRGGSWDDDAHATRSAARRGSESAWQMQDPQMPKSIWHLTDAGFVGFRVVRPFTEPDAEQRARAWEPDLKGPRRILERQRRGER